MDPTHVSALLTGLNGLRTLVGAVVEARDDQKLATLKVDLTKQIIETQAQLGQVLGAIIEKDARIASLEERVRELDQQKRDRDRYELAELAPGSSTFAYRLKAAGELSERQAEPSHFLCQPCFDGGKRGVLGGFVRWGTMEWTCPLCEVELKGASGQ